VGPRGPARGSGSGAVVDYRFDGFRARNKINESRVGQERRKRIEEM
jgi:hypothetical protein